MNGTENTTTTVEESLKTLTYQASLTSTDVDISTVEVTDQSIEYSVPRFDDTIPPGCIGITSENRSSHTPSISTVYDEQSTVELYRAVTNRVKWFTRMSVTPGSKDHVLFFFDSTCRYTTQPHEVRLPGVIRGPDATQGFLPEWMDPVVGEDTYLVPVHLLPDRYWERSDKCHDCTLPILDQSTRRWIPRDDPETASYKCPKCGSDTSGIAHSTRGGWFLHDTQTEEPTGNNRCGPVSNDDKYAFMDWLLDVDPGATMQTPDQFPDNETVLNDGTIVDWLHPLEPVTNPTEQYLPGVKPFVTVQPPDQDTAFVIDQQDVMNLSNAVDQQEPTE